MFTASLKDTEIEKYGLVPHKIAIDGISNLRASLYYKALRNFPPKNPPKNYCQY